ncbi:hypothetical protein Tsubulata_000298 [Turnera subulata]|uniref:DNA-directed RNA polymerase III subunit RPC3 n=1 Tax=Turnera subulata TaxID=218843 RepID=A0A9Q0J077_9ROSI|nr:hypothetical protein Tsubulata_000298 [Turnera subulata]
MVSQHGIKFAVHIITKHFGNLVAKVCECLLRRGALTLQNIVRYTELTPTQVKNSLLVLIQHNCVQAFILEEPGGFGDTLRLITQYVVLFDNILHRLRFSKFLALVSLHFDKPCLDLLEGLLQHGRLSLQQMFDRARETEGSNVTLSTVQENLHKLVTARYVERCPIPEPVLEPPSENDVAARKRAAKSKIIVEAETLEQRVVAASFPSDTLRFSVAVNPELNIDCATEHAGEKRKFDALESDIDGGATTEKIILWRANCEEFVRQLRNKACIENVRARLDDDAATVFSAMVEASGSEEKKIKVVNSAPLSVNAIYEEVIKSEKGRNMTFNHVRASLVQLSSQPRFVRVADETYSIDFKNIVELAQNDEVESVVLKRYGRTAYKIFRLLSKDGRLVETDKDLSTPLTQDRVMKISDSIFVEKKESANMLYKLWQDGYLLMERLVAGATQFLLWKVDKQKVWWHFLDEMFHGALNLSLRVAYEIDQRDEILKLREGASKEKRDRLVKVRMLMESSLMKLDDAIMLFHDF